MKRISTCLWFDNQAEAAALFYSTVFKNTKSGRTALYSESSAKASGQKAGSLMTIEFEIEGHKFFGLNGGPQFKFTPAISFFVACESEEEIQDKWQKLSQGGSVRMALDKYPWAEKYGWTADKFGVDWQLILSPREQKIVPAFLFTNELFGKGEEAMQFYTSIFEHSKISALARDEKTNTVLHGAFNLGEQGFVLMEGAGKHEFSPSMATSFLVSCENQMEIDRYWQKLIASGGTPGSCGWLQDRYGVSWQVVPAQLAEIMSDPEKADRAMSALVSMTKIDLAGVLNAL